VTQGIKIIAYRNYPSPERGIELEAPAVFGTEIIYFVIIAVSSTKVKRFSHNTDTLVLQKLF